MSAKAVLVFCAQAILFKFTLSQCIAPGLTSYGLTAPGLAYDGLVAPLACDGLNGLDGRGLAYNGLAPYAFDGLAWAGIGLAYDGLYPAMDFTPTTGGIFPVTSASAIPPVGISITSDNVYEGALNVVGELPFVGTAIMEGIVPSEGAGAINHACGNGINAMVSETTAFGPGYAGAAIAPAAAIAPFGNMAPGAIGPLGVFAPISSPALGYGEWSGRGCGCAL